ncbi:ArsR/SmtB family transcription factor [Brevibacterium marinum]|uniref:DNA-binding transcriptional ArsR family regulator n=1 Tax=Brevibacterium marinum TaxID=418643 RepID=A0A846RYK5_9MICO|nr:metalloregulator ArsR/SmtB family transcription factor [Brevibacterium marinum]NJC56525.1 DNA-binding transcriptional ArsR family regulator [Brevibacterium marinum]
MDALAALADPARRRIVECLRDSEVSAGELADVMEAEFGLVQPATSRHLRRLRETGLVHSRPDGTSRLYSLDPGALRDIAVWLEQFRGLWSDALSSLDAEVQRGKSSRRSAAP